MESLEEGGLLGTQSRISSLYEDIYWSQRTSLGWRLDLVCEEEGGRGGGGERKREREERERGRER